MVGGQSGQGLHIDGVCASVIPNGSDQQLRRAGHRLKTVEQKTEDGST